MSIKSSINKISNIRVFFSVTTTVENENNNDMTGMTSTKVLVNVKPRRHFGDPSGKVFQGSFCSERSICHPEPLTAVLEGVVAICLGMGLVPDW